MTLQEQAEALYLEIVSHICRFDDDGNCFKCVGAILAFAEQVGLQERARCAGIADQYCDTFWTAYKSSDGDDRADPYVEGKSDGAEIVAQAIREQP
jgi:hypothetical protein